MGAICFHSPSGEVLVRGSERHRAGHIVNAMACAALPLDTWEDDPVLHLLPPDCYLRNSDSDRSRYFKEDFRIWMVGDNYFHLGGERVSTFSVALNTALAMGSRPVRLLARLHGQCEIHTWVDGRNRAWMAGVVEDGRESGILRAEKGWEEVAGFLRQRDDETVVTSYSVCKQFPSPPESWEYRESESEEDYFGSGGRAWYSMDPEEQWRIAMDELREQGGLELEPEGFDDFWFGKERITMFDIDRMRQEVKQETISHGHDA